MAKDSACKFCKAGLYSTVAASNAVGHCKACVAGQYYDGVGANSNSMCKGCQAGKTQRQAGEAYCLPCAPGKFQPHTGSVTCQECVPNTKSEASNAIQCVNCSIGTDSVKGSSKCLSCIAGRYNNRQGESCQECGRGQYSNTGAGLCVSCPVGFYSKRNAQAFCLPCRAGAYNTKSGRHACTQCAAGQYRDSGMVVAASCTKCPNGYYQKNQGSAECLPKTVGWVLLGCLDHLACTDTSRCPVGTYQNDLRSSTRCLQCPSGFSSTSGATECQSCNKGEYGVQAEEEESVGLCHKCGIHQYGPTQKAVRCFDCPAGWNQPLLGSESCVDLKYKKPEECELVTQYLDNTDNDPLAWNCVACPNGAYCTGLTTWKDVVAKVLLIILMGTLVLL